MRMPSIFRAHLGAAVGLMLVAAAGLSSCAGDGSEPVTEPQDFVAQAGDFECLTSWPRVRTLRITNRIGKVDEALALAQNPEPGRQFPIGTIIQIFPGEAMVKRGPDFDPENNNWEYFELDVTADGATIAKRGRDDIINQFGGQCFGCHEAARTFDFMCERDRGCVELPISSDTIIALQDLDPRCAP